MSRLQLLLFHNTLLIGIVTANMKKINIEFIENADQRYDTCGDYWEDYSTFQVRVTRYRNEKYSHLVLIHELVEMLLCKHRGIKMTDIDNFDLSYVDEGEPGNDPAAPYHKEHLFATEIEKLCAAELGVEWGIYEEALDNGEPAQSYTTNGEDEYYIDEYE